MRRENPAPGARMHRRKNRFFPEPGRKALLAAHSQFAIIAPEIGLIFLFIALVSCSPFLVALWYGEERLLLPMATAPAGFGIIGVWLAGVPKVEGEARLSVAFSAVALIWLAAALIGALPYTFALNLPYTDSVFEAMSGWTGTGFSLLPSIDATPKTILFWRSLTQWMGGLGIVAFTIALAGRSGLTRFRLYRSEGRSETFMPSVVTTAVEMWRIYLVLTALGIGLVLLSGIPLWDAVNIVMTAISTGGFAVHSAGILYYDSPLLEMLVVPIMIAGALPFKLYFLLHYKKRFQFFSDRQALLLFALILAGCAVITLDLATVSALPPAEALREGLFMTVSGITCTGFQNADPKTWYGSTVMVLAALMFVGGSAGSTAGGIKLGRVILGLEMLRWWFRRLHTGWRTITPLRHDGRPILEHLPEYEVSKSMLVVVLFVLMVAIATLLLLHLAPQDGFDSADIIFEVVSAASSVGLSTGFVNPGLSPAAKWLFVIVMWAGRLEIVPVLALIFGAARIRRPAGRTAGR
ncbi:Trk system potassium uptake protein TrkG [Methanoculleus chikugoensis]|jgi:trk system potassium uptake protein TrkH|uniref:Trk system potassium uptake protein TrkG n=1 Tax=Methanoculleus chikugoensis TaxID=118126 RepID=A0A1M4MP73_9EURY|nr:Trk system potassium uptake protein TrkG [Methanoculleus chikugoensis]